MFVRSCLGIVGCGMGEERFEAALRLCVVVSCGRECEKTDLRLYEFVRSSDLRNVKREGTNDFRVHG
jgi:hypothetical protein